MADLTAEFVQKILDLSPIDMEVIDGRYYADRKLHPVVPPVVAELNVATLTGVRDYLTVNPDRLDLESLVVHVRGHNDVQVRSRLSGEWSQRHFFLHAFHEPKGFPFGKYLSIEDFIVHMQTHFVQDETTAAIVRLAGNLVQESNVTCSDDGMTQTVTAKTGIARVAEVSVPNPVALAPFRTFLEIDQPASKFVLRLKRTDAGPAAALYDADGGCWSLEAIRRIRDWLRVNIPEVVTILA
jgi:hypothetical protein